MTEQLFSLRSLGSFAGRFGITGFEYLSYTNCGWQKVGGVRASMLASKVPPFHKAQGAGAGKKHQGCKFKLSNCSKYLIVSHQCLVFTDIQCKVLAPNFPQEHYRFQL